MSELINNSNSRLKELENFSLSLINGEDGKQLIGQYQDVISTISPVETMQVLDRLLADIPLETVKASLGKLMNVFYRSLDKYKWEKPGEGHFLHYLMLENREAEKIFTEIKSINKIIFKDETDRTGLTARLKSLFEKLKDYELHYIKKENILFPHIEKVFPEYRCLQLMWAFHDDFRKTLRLIKLNLEDNYPDYDLLNKEIGKLFFIVLPVIFREEQVVFPVALKSLPQAAWDEMMEQSYDPGWCYIDPPKRNYIKTGSQQDGRVDLGSGLLAPAQVQMIFNALPVDITFIDENDEVKYFSESKERLFPRSRSIIGRKVQNCHPPQSVEIVNKIVAAFRNGEKDHADFWIQMKGRFVYIRYFAVRSETGEYRGTLEVSQDVTEARELTNERRLLNWED